MRSKSEKYTQRNGRGNVKWNMEFVTNIKCYLARQAKSTQPGGYQVKVEKKERKVTEHDDKTKQNRAERGRGNTERIEKEKEIEIAREPNGCCSLSKCDSCRLHTYTSIYLSSYLVL